MSKKKQVEDGSLQTADGSQETVEIPQAETPVSKPVKPTKTDYVCPACKHTTCLKIGTPYHKGELTLQYVQCEKCEHLSAITLE
jgi:hypothetical protein